MSKQAIRREGASAVNRAPTTASPVPEAAPAARGAAAPLSGARRFGPAQLTPGAALQLQQAVGNRAARRLFADAAPEPGRAAGAGLPSHLKAGIERLSGLSMDDVRVQRRSAEPARLGALAFTRGPEIHLAPGQERHLAHEAWHVVQQKEGRVPATAELHGQRINADAALEREADTMGARASSTGQSGSAEASRGEPSRGAGVAEIPSSVGVVQRVLDTQAPAGRPSFTLAHKTKTVAPRHDTARRPIRELKTDLDKLLKKANPNAPGSARKKENKLKAQLDEKAVEGREAAEKLSDEEKDALLSAGWNLNPDELDLSGQLRDGPGLSDNQLQAIERLSSSQVGKVWLSHAGLFTEPDADNYLRESKYYDWLLLEAETRVQLATMAHKDRIGANERTPAYTLGRHFMIHHGDSAEKQQAESARDSDVRSAFVDTMLHSAMNSDAEEAVTAGAVVEKTHGVHGAIRKALPFGGQGRILDPQQIASENMQAARILEKLFLVLQAGLKIYDKTAKTHVELPNATDVARALAHGGRVNIRIPAIKEGETGRELLDFLGITTEGKGAKGAVVTRGFGTHNLWIKPNPKQDGEPRDASQRAPFIELGGKGAARRNFVSKFRPSAQHVHQWGMNVAAGGLGKLDHNGDVILPDGAHGHMYIGFTAPDVGRDGGLSIGMETTGPGAASLVGYVHGPHSTEATANPESSFGGHKTDKIGSGGPSDVKKVWKGLSDIDKGEWQATNSRYVDLEGINGGNWLTYLKGLEAHFDAAKNRGERRALELLVGPKANFRKLMDRGAGDDRD
jgi:hypothetical protein